jgi:hypothetical protein
MPRPPIRLVCAAERIKRASADPSRTQLLTRLLGKAADVRASQRHAPYVALQQRRHRPLQVDPVCSVVTRPVRGPAARASECGPAF